MGSKTIFGIIIIVVIAVFIAIFLVLRNAQPHKTTKNTKGKVAAVTIQKTKISITDIVHDPLVYEGLTVETEAIISDWVTKKSFMISQQTGGGLFGNRQIEQILVISKNDFKLHKEIIPTDLGLGESVNVNVRGEVRFMDKNQLEEALGVNLDNELLLIDDSNISKWEKGSVILLESVTKL